MRRTTSKRLLNLGRLASLLGAVGATATWMVWTYAPDWVDRVDDRVRKHYIDQAKIPLQVARQLLGRDPKAGIAALEQYRVRFARFAQGDHYFRHRAEALQLLANAYQQRGEFESAAACMQELVEASPRDLVAKMQGFEILAKTGRRTDAIEGLEILHARLPESQQVADSLSDRLAEDGDFERAWQVQLETHRSYRSSRWYIRWKRYPPELWRNGLSSLVAPARFGNRLRLEFSLERDPRGLRIGLPIHSNLELRKMHLTVDDRKSVIEIPLTPGQYHLNEMRQIGDTVRSFGTSRPWIEIPLDKLRLQEESHFEFSAEFRELHASGMRSFAAAWMPQLIDLLTRKQDLDGLKTLATMRQTLLPESSCDIYWHDTDQKYSRKRRQQVSLDTDPTDDAIRFDVTLPLGVSLSAIRFDAPELIGLEIEFVEFSIISGDQVHELDLDAIEYLHNMSRNGSTITATGPDPHLSIALPQSVQVDSLRLRGVAR